MISSKPLDENGFLQRIHQVVVVDGDGVMPEYLLYLALAGRSKKSIYKCTYHQNN
jgi:hypothetical protein